MQRPVRSQLDPPPSAHAVTLPSDMLAMRRSGRTLDAAAAVSTAGAPLPGCGTRASPSMGRASSASVPPSRACPTPASSRRATSRRAGDSRCPARALRRAAEAGAGPEPALVHTGRTLALYKPQRAALYNHLDRRALRHRHPQQPRRRRRVGMAAQALDRPPPSSPGSTTCPRRSRRTALTSPTGRPRRAPALQGAASPISAPGSDFARSPDAANHPFGAYSAPFFFGT